MAVLPMNRSSFHNNYDTYIFDADGVLWLGAKPIDGAIKLFDQLQRNDKQIFVLTNNTTKSREHFVEKCAKLGFNVKAENIVNPAVVMVHELNKMYALHPELKELPIYLLGSYELAATLESQLGIKCIGTGPDPIEKYTNTTILMDIDVSQRVSAVVTSFDSHLSYPKVMKAVNYLKDPEVKFITTNEDLTFPGSNPNIIVPGAGTVSVVIRAISGREPVVMGKPHSAAFNYMREMYNIGAIRTLMIGDRCDTDISFGMRNNLDTLLVLTGVHTLTDVDTFRERGAVDCIPCFYSQSVKDLLLTE